MKVFSDPVAAIMYFGQNAVLLSGGEVVSSSRTPVNPITDGGEFLW